MPPERVDLTRAKAGFRGLFGPSHPARVALEAEPDQVTEQEFLLLYPILVRLAGTRTEDP